MTDPTPALPEDIREDVETVERGFGSNPVPHLHDDMNARAALRRITDALVEALKRGNRLVVEGHDGSCLQARADAYQAQLDAERVIRDLPDHADLDAAVFEANAVRAELREAIRERDELHTLYNSAQDEASKAAEDMVMWRERYRGAIRERDEAREQLEAARAALRDLCDRCEELRLNYTDPEGVGRAMLNARALPTQGVAEGATQGAAEGYSEAGPEPERCPHGYRLDEPCGNGFCDQRRHTPPEGPSE